MSGGPSDSNRKDFPNAIKSNLDKWVEWRRDLNQLLADATLTGSPIKEIAPLATYLQRGNKHIAVDNPKTLLAYSASQDNATVLEKRKFLNYGIPRVKVYHLKPGTTHSEIDSSSSNSSPGEMENIYPDYSDDGSQSSLDYPYEELPDTITRGGLVSQPLTQNSPPRTASPRDRPKRYTTPPDYPNSDNDENFSPGFSPSNEFHRKSANRNLRNSDPYGQEPDYENLHISSRHHKPLQHQNSHYLHNYGSSGYSPTH